MSDRDPVEAYRLAVDRLSELKRSVAAQRDHEVVHATLTDLKLAVVRAYGGRRPRALGGLAGKTKILAYLKERPGVWVYGGELEAISGIGEWARRIRELRVEDGYAIEEQAGVYRLVSTEPNADVAARWQLLNKIRRHEGSGKDRIWLLFAASVGQVLTREDLDYVARIKEGSRRVRELRDEEGWPIESHFDAPDLQPGQYRLVSADELDKRDTRQRLYPEDLRQKVFERDEYTCWNCRRNREKAEAAGDRRFYLEVHHRQAVAEQLDALPVERLNDMTNLATYCHACHREETARFQRRRRQERRDARGTGNA